MKWLLLFLVLAIVAVGGAYWALPSILHTVLIGQAAARGIVVSELEIQRPVWGKAVVDTVAFSVGSNEARAEAVTIGFTWDSLSAAQATNVEVAKLHITAHEDATERVTPIESGAINTIVFDGI